MHTILVAENEAGVRKLLAEALRRAGYRVLAASSGQEAIDLAGRHAEPIDLLVTDIVMAGIGGADLYATLKAERPDLPVLFISGYMSREPVQGAFLKKPFTPAELVEQVRKLIGQNPEAGRA